jgi:hypothetical protein
MRSDAPAPAASARTVGRLLLVAGLVAAVALGAIGITNEDIVSLQGDMPRHLMNGVFIHDFLMHPRFTVDGVLTYAQHYFARYPALSLGHHPPFLPVALVPFFTVFGISIMAGRLAVLTFFAISTWLLYTLARRQYGPVVGGWAALLFATCPFAVEFAQIVLNEMPTVCLVLAAFNVLLWFRASGRLRHLLLFLGVAALSLTSKQTAVFVFPAYAILLLAGGGWRLFTERRILYCSLAGAAIAVGLVVALIVLSPYNAALVLNVIRTGVGLSDWRDIVSPIAREQLWPALVWLVPAGVAAAVVTRDRRIGFSLCWIGAVLLGVFLVTGPWEAARYSIIAVPAYCLCGASIAAGATTGVRRTLTTLALAAAVAAQVVVAARVRPAGGGGYEEMAEIVLHDTVAPTVLYSGSVDTGFFVFFVRKHDPAQRLVVLRSDKVLTTSMMNSLSHEDNIHSPEEIYPLLDKYGTRFVVIEDRPTGSTVLDWLRDEVKGDRFIERRRIRIATTDRRLQGVDLVVYEYKDAKPADFNTVLDIKVPLVGRDIRLRLSDLQPAAAR